MTYRQLFALIEEARLTPEAAASWLGVSGMTIRRWREDFDRELLPEIYELAARRAAQRLVVEGKISPASPAVEAILRDGDCVPFLAALRALGFPPELLKDPGNPAEALLEGLSDIAQDSAKRRRVERNRRRIFSFLTLGSEWKEPVSRLWAALRSRDLSEMDKLVAYGALYYLIAPVHVIPREVPVAGSLDDFAVVSLAADFYERHFPLGGRSRRFHK